MSKGSWLLWKGQLACLPTFPFLRNSFGHYVIQYKSWAIIHISPDPIFIQALVYWPWLFYFQSTCQPHSHVTYWSHIVSQCFFGICTNISTLDKKDRYWVSFLFLLQSSLTWNWFFTFIILQNFILQLLLVRWYLNQRVDWLDSRAELDRSGTLRTCWGHRWCIVNREAQWFCFPSHSQLPKTHIPFTIPVRSNFGRSCQILGFSHAVLGVLDTAAPTNSLGVTIFRGQKSLSFDFKLTWVS